MPPLPAKNCGVVGTAAIRSCRAVFAGGLVYFCTGYWTPSLLAVWPDGSGDVTDTHVEFAVRGVPHNPSPLIVDERLYLVSDQGVLTCINCQGWQRSLGGSGLRQLLCFPRRWPTDASICPTRTARSHFFCRATNTSSSAKTASTAARWPRRRLSIARSFYAATPISIASTAARRTSPKPIRANRIKTKPAPRKPRPATRIPPTPPPARPSAPRRPLAPRLERHFPALSYAALGGCGR